MKSLVVKRSAIVAGHKTSVSLEDGFWKSVKEIAAYSGMSVSDLITEIDSERHNGNLSSAIRLFVLSFYREQFLDQLGIRDKRPEVQTVSTVPGKSSKSGASG